jgi:hypothetical protein
METRMELLVQNRLCCGKHPAQARLCLQLLSVLFLLLSGCATTPPPGLSRLPEGLYVFDAPIFYEKGMARVTHTSRGARVQLLETFQGDFTLRPDASGQVDMVEDHISYPGLRRTLKGSGQLTATGKAEGQAVIWLKSAGPISRNHREGPWTLRQATPEEEKAFRLKQQAIEKRKQRAREAGLDI